MANSNKAEARVKDLSTWSTRALRRRLASEMAMCKALFLLGYEGLHRELLSLDVKMIKRVLIGRKTNEA